MWHESVQLLDVSDDFRQLYRVKSNYLPQIVPCFFVPPLEDKPQNPILEALKLENINSNLPPRLFQPHLLPQELAVLSLGTVDQEPEAKVEEIWKNALIRKRGVRNGLLSWDRLRPTHLNKASSTAFVSEQDHIVSASARYYVQPQLYDARTSFVYVTEQELLASLKMTVLGISSPLHTWNSSSERFVQSGTVNTGMRNSIVVDGKDEIVSSRQGLFFPRFLTIGTLLRRLESLLMTLRSRSAKEGPTIHAFAHSLSSALVYIREALASCPPSNAHTESGERLMLSEICGQHSIYEELLVALAALCNRSERFSPEDYPQLDSSPNPLLSHICECLKFHIERQSPAIIRATIAFILSGASQEYINEVGRSIGFGGQPTQNLSTVLRETGDIYQLEADDEEEGEEDIFDLLDKVETAFPTFFPQNLLQVLPAAQKSLVLLRIAEPDHSLLNTPMRLSSVRWLWTVEEIMAAFNNLPLPSEYRTLPLSIPLPLSPASVGTSYKPELSGFRIFDLEPGLFIGEPSLKINDSSAQLLHAFIDNFPETLPSITPTFSELTALMFKDLIHHASTLSSTLLSLFITSTDNLNFRSHLVLLRSYLLIAAPSFKSRFLAALFSDAGEYEVDQSSHSVSIRSLRRKPSKKIKGSKQPWAVGLSPNLLDRETWPPVGADLSFFLRTVIVDSLEKGKETEEGMAGQNPVIEEAGWRLGFAIRDLPTGPGRDKWLNPLCTALDFLYMDYKPPRPLEILISSDILSKYQRMFTFILRLLRVESALKSLFRMSTHRSTSNFLFPTLTKSRKLLLHFRFISQAFVSSLSGYIFDTAIGGNFDPFLARLSSGDSSLPNSSASERAFEFSDVFELAQCHSVLLDDILSACLLRSGQKGVGDLLRHCLELVLEFTIVVGELHRGRLEEYQAAPLIEDLFQRFRTKMTTFTKVLKGLVEKNPSSANWPADVSAAGIRRPTGGLDALYHLLIRLDLGDWWSKTKESVLA
ncbi:gamma-tubulin complex, DGRIP91/SPC98 component protein [Phlegmacium glaucopus]|nr:gamma-tubulin complex, DGRIP91/SPC98 component protein [Phlegmacium glaucopus]